MRLTQEFWFEPIHKERLLRIISRPHHWRSDEFGQRLGKAALAHHPKLSQDAIEPPSGIECNPAGAVERAVIERAAGDQEFAEPQQRVGDAPLGFSRNGRNGFNVPSRS